MILALISRKGGVGKTTTAVSVSAALAARGHRVLLVDLDSQASASLSVGLSRSDLAPSMADVLLRDVPAHQAVHPTATAGLDIIPASSDLVSADYELGAFRHKERRLADRLEPLRGEYSFILIDCPPSLSLLPLNAMVASDGFVVPVVPQYLAWAGLENLLQASGRITTRTGARTRLVGLLLTMVDYRLKATREIVEAIRLRFGRDVFAVEIRTNVRLAEAPGAGKPIFAFAPEATGAKAYGLLTEELLLRCWPAAPADEAALAAAHPSTGDPS
jgi:chromosome partitioning protein